MLSDLKIGNVLTIGLGIALGMLLSSFLPKKA